MQYLTNRTIWFDKILIWVEMNDQLSEYVKITTKDWDVEIVKLNINNAK